MKNLKTYEGFFDFFKSQPSEDDKIALEYITRLKKVKGISPYKIEFIGDPNDGGYAVHGQISQKVDKWTVDFEDTPIKLWSVISFKSGGFDLQSQELLASKNISKYNNREFYALKILCEGEPENCKAKPRILKELVELVKLVYENDKEARRIEKIKINMNKSADLIEDEQIEESLVEEEPEVQEIRDICLELSDIGFRVRVNELPQFKKGEIKIKVEIDDFRKGYRTPFNINDIKETLERVKDFITERGYIVDVYIPEKRIRFEDSDDDKSIDYLITWCEIYISSTNWFGKTVKSN
jgi:hypothetical protein